MKLFLMCLYVCILTTAGFSNSVVRVRRGLPGVNLKEVGPSFPAWSYRPPTNLQQTSWGAYANYYYQLNSNYGQGYVGQTGFTQGATNLRRTQRASRIDTSNVRREKKINMNFGAGL